MIKFSIYLALSLITVFPILRAGMVKQGFSAITQTAMMFTALVAWVGLIWYAAPPSNWLIAVGVVIGVFEVALWLSSKLVNRWQSLGYLG